MGKPECRSCNELIMIRIEYPVKKPVVKKDGKQEMVFCMIRKRWVLLTPEEWVRQNFLLFLTAVMHYPASLIAVEKQILLGDVKKRFDIVVYGQDTNPFMIVECKEMNVALNQQTLYQVIRYNTNMRAKFVIITNGTSCFGFANSGTDFLALQEFPLFQDNRI